MTKSNTRQRHVWAVLWTKGNQRRTLSLHSSKSRAEAARDTHKPAKDREHLELEQMPINGPA